MVLFKAPFIRLAHRNALESDVKYSIMDSLFKALPLYGYSQLHNSVVFFVFALSVTTVIGVCYCGHIDLWPRQFKGPYKILRWKLGTDNIDQ